MIVRALLVATGLVAPVSAPAAEISLSPVDLTVDTVLDLRRGDRVVIENLVGEISIAAWDRDQLEIRADDSDAALLVRRSGSTVRVTRDDRKGRRHSVEASLRLPAWVDLDLSGRSLEVWVEGIDGRVAVNNVSGDVWIEDAGGGVDVRTVEGEIDITRANGGVRASSQSDEVRLRDVSGPVAVHSGSGDIELMDIRSDQVRAETLDGDIDFSGDIAPGGEYGFFVHDGDAIIAIPEASSAQVSVSTFDGDFESEFPVRIERFTGGREFDFLVGDGRARIQIEVFDGEIRLLRR